MKRIGILVVQIAIVALFVFPISARAQFFLVDCSGTNPGAYPSITAALNAIINNAGPNLISVSGTCTENISIFNQNNLKITSGAPGSTAVITNAASPAQVTVQISDSHLVTFDGLSIQGGNPGLFMTGSDLSMFRSVIEKNVGTGASVAAKSELNLGVSCIIRNNGSVGLFVSDLSIAVVMSPIQILNNNSDGAAVFISGQINFAGPGGHLIEGNGGHGISVAAGGHVVLQGVNLPTMIRNNGVDGLAFTSGSTGSIYGQNTIENNGPVGVLIDSSTVTFFGSTTITGHPFTGVNLTRGGELTFSGSHQITGNGNPTDGAGIRVERSTLSLQDGATVSNNVGPGIFGDAHSGIVLGPTASVTNNTFPGVRLRHQSLVGLTGPVTIQGNAGVNITCDSTSLAYGQLAGITGVQCQE